MIPETRAETLANTESKKEITDTGDCSVLVIVFFFLCHSCGHLLDFTSSHI